MRIGVWGAGEIGTALIYRLVTTSFASELRWINRSEGKMSSRVVDLEHGLAFAPSCWSVRAHRQERAGAVLGSLDALVLTLGHSVPPGGTRNELFGRNRELFREVVLPALTGFEGIVLVVTNPVDLMARLIHREAKLAPERVLGLGTVVETARLRASLSSYLSPRRPAREVWAYAVGTHDECFVPVLPGHLGLGATMKPEEMEKIIGAARQEVVKGASRVKQDDRSTLHPIVEGVVRVLESVAFDQRALLTVSTLDPDSGLYYSVPCSVGRPGVVERHLDILDEPGVRDGLAQSKRALLEVLKATEEKTG